MLPQSMQTNVAISLSDMLPLLSHAAGHQRAWLDDFSDDVVHISNDLYEVLLAYRNMMDRKAA